MLKKIFFVFAFTIASQFSALAQNTNALPIQKTLADLPPGNIQLLKNYTHTKAEAIDTSQGIISKPEGITIYYQIGKYVSDYADNRCGKGECLWYKVQHINGSEFRIGLTKEGKIVATVTEDNANVYSDTIHANFYTQTKSAEEIADFLIMILTYQVGYKSETAK
jgi:hypothetical protein